jgi:hypothetical protein
MEKLSANPQKILEVCAIYEAVKNRSSSLLRSRPQSIASGIVYYWVLKNNIPIPVETFSQLSDLSTLTIIKIQKEVKEFMNSFQNELRSFQ